MKIILKANYDGEQFSGDCDYALLDLTPECAQHLIERHEQFTRFRKETGAYEAYWFDCQVTFFTTSPLGRAYNEREASRLEKRLESLDGGKEWKEVSDNFAIPEAFESNTECDQLITREEGVAFFCYPKHTGVHVVTNLVPVETLRRAL